MFAVAATVLLCLTPRAALAAFQVPQSVPASQTPLAIVVADLNGDGKPDLVTAGSSGHLGVLRNTMSNGANTPTFATVQDINVGSVMQGLAAADFDGDGKVDLVYPDTSAFTVVVLRNTTGTGASTFSFAAGQSFPVGSAQAAYNPIAVTVADFNGDGKPDVVTANNIQSSETASVLLNTSSGSPATLSFATAVTLGAPVFPSALAATDINTDGKPDLVVINGSSISFFMNTTAPFDTTASFSGPFVMIVGNILRSVAAADFNADGKPDLVVSNSGSTTVSVLFNQTPNGGATPLYASQVTFAVGPSPFTVTAADFNQDGKLDIAAASFDDSTLALLLNATAAGAASPSFAAAETFSVGALPIAVAAADLNADGTPDAAVANSNGNSVSVVLFSHLSGVLQFSSPPTSVPEAGGSLTLTVARTESTRGPVSAVVSVSGGTATLGTDLSFTGAQTVSWAAGDSANKTVSLSIAPDAVDEDDETVQVSIANAASGVGATLGAQASATFNIVDDDSVSLSVTDVGVTEGNSGGGQAVFTVVRTGLTVRTVSVQYATSDGTAMAGSDYMATTGTLVLAPNESSKTVTVPILGDTVPEANETFTLTLSNPTNAVISASQAVGTIHNDDLGACIPRPRVTQTATASGGALNVHVASTPLNTSADNPLQQIRFGTFQDATVSLNGQAVTSGQTVTLGAGAVSVDFAVRRVTAGQATTVPFTVTDGCGEWNTFVGGGAGVGF